MNRWLGMGWVAVLAAGVVAGCTQKPAETAERKKDRGPVAVRTARVERRDLSETLLFTGELEAPLSVEVKPKIQGRLEKLELTDGRPVTEGAEVKKGEVIAELDRRELEAQVALAEAQARQAEVAMEDRGRERQRLEALFAEAVATEQARDAAVTAHESARAARAQAQAQLALAKVNLDEAVLRAPMDGVVAERHADPGAMVGPSAGLVRIVQMDPLRLMLAIPVRLLPMLEEGKTRVAVVTDVQPGREREGVVPAASVIRVLERQLVFTVRDEVARAAEVKTGIRAGEDVEIVEGLAEGEEYVTMGQNKLTDGAAVERVAPAAEAGSGAR